jgi:hypothetical protein
MAAASVSYKASFPAPNHAAGGIDGHVALTQPGRHLADKRGSLLLRKFDGVEHYVQASDHQRCGARPIGEA